MSGDYVAQARFWARELPRRAKRESIARMPPAAFARIVRNLESATRPRDLTLNPGFPRVRDIVQDTYTLSAAELLRVPEVPGLVDEEAYWYPPVRVRRLTGVDLDIDSGLVFADGWVINGTGNGHRWSMDSAFLTGATYRVRTGPTRTVDRTIATMGDVAQHYHFFCEALPGILRAHEADPDALFVTSLAPSTFARDLLGDLGVDHRLVPAGQVWRCTDLLVAENYPRDRTHPADLRMLKDRLGPHGGAGRWGERVYISRAGGLRGLAGEDRLEEILRERGFSVLYLERMSFADQVASLAGARLVVAPHGAGLSKALFTEPGGTMIELATGELWTNAYRRLAAVAGLDYRLLLLRNVAGDEFGTGDADDAIAQLEPLLT